MAGEMDDFAVGVRGHVRIWVNTSAVIQFLPQDLPLFLAAHPDVHIGLEERVSSDIVDALEQGQADIGIFADNIAAPQIENVLPARQAGAAGAAGASVGERKRD